MINIKSSNLITNSAILALPISFLIGSLFVNIIFISISLYTLIWLIYSKKFSIISSKSYIFFFLLFLLFIISSTFSSHKSVAFENSFFFLSCILFLISLDLIIFSKSDRLLLISRLVFFLIIFICIDLWFQKIVGTNLIGYPAQQASRLTSFFGDEQIPGSFVFKLSPFAIYYLFHEREKQLIIKFKTIILIFIYFSILITGERAASILSSLAIIFLILLNIKNIDKRMLTSYSVIFVIIFLTLLNLKNSIIKERILYTIIQTKNNVYLNYYENSINIFKKNIFLGTGPQTYRYECKKISNSCSTHPHNFLLELLSDTGIFSIFLFFVALLVIVSDKIKKLRSKFDRSLIITFTILFFFPLIPTGSFFTSFHMILSWFSLGFLYSIKFKN